MRLKQFLIAILLMTLALSVKASTVGTIDINANGSQWAVLGTVHTRSLYSASGFIRIDINYDTVNLDCEYQLFKRTTNSNNWTNEGGFFSLGVISGVTDVEECVDHFFKTRMR